ncbi:MAG: ATP-binding protein [Acidimicrobiia bacterium]|nr:ATP-binding protein [Acidimicrobiia bacterium]MDH5236954.1 ATP-binding protein [Acidimicrobiia bacterium]
MKRAESRRDVVLEIPARADYLELVRAVVAAAAHVDPGFGDDRIEDLRLAVSEATTNAIRAHASLGSDNRIRVRCNVDDDRIEVQVQDRGPGFDPGEIPELPSIDDPARLLWESGLGLPLMRQLTDESEWESDDEGTLVRLVVYTRSFLRD